MYPRRMMIVGAIMVLVAAAIFAFGKIMLGEEIHAFESAARFEGGTAGAAGQADLGELVVIEGKVSAKNKILVHGFVDASKDHQVKGGSWTSLEMYRQPVLADLARGEILLNSEYLCTAAKGNNVLETGERSAWNNRVRYIGLKRGDPITAIGTLTSLAPAALAVKYWYSGSVADYRNYLPSSLMGLYVFCAIITVTGAGFFLLGLKRR